MCRADTVCLRNALLQLIPMPKSCNLMRIIGSKDETDGDGWFGLSRCQIIQTCDEMHRWIGHVGDIVLQRFLINARMVAIQNVMEARSQGEAPDTHTAPCRGSTFEKISQGLENISLGRARKYTNHNAHLIYHFVSMPSSQDPFSSANISL